MFGIGDRWLIGLGGLATLLALTAAVAFENTRRLNDDALWVAHTHEVRDTLEEIAGRLREAEARQHAYLILGDETLEAEMVQGVETASGIVERLAKLTVDNASQQARIAELERRISALKRLWSDAGQARREQGFAAAREIVRGGQARAAMSELQNLLDQMQRAEYALLKVRSLKRAETYRIAIASGLLSGTAAIVGVLAFTALLRRHLRGRLAAAAIIAEQAERLRTTLTSIGDAVIATDAAGRVSSMNRAAESLTGWTAAEAAGRPLADVFRIINEQTRQPAENPAYRAISEGTVVGLANHTLLIARDGTERPIDDSAAPIHCAEGQIVGCVLVFRDVTEQRSAARRLAESEARKTAILNTALDCVITIDQHDRIVDFNPAAEQTFGYRAADVIGRAMADLIVPPDQRDAHRQGLARYLETGEGPLINRRLELFAVRADGGVFPVELAITCLPSGECKMFTGYLRDISDRRQAEERLRRNEERFRLLVEQIHDYAIFTTDSQGRATSWNEGVRRVLGFDMDEFIGRDIVPSIFTPEDVRDGAAERELRQAASQGTAGDDRWMRRKDGSRFFAVGVTTSLKDERGDLVGFIKVMRDQTERHRLEHELRQAAAELSAADRRKDEFLAVLAHELRNPLTPLCNGLELIKLAGGDARAVEQARGMMQRQVDQMVRLIDDLLDVSRITQNKIALRKQPVDLAGVVRQAVETSQPLIAAGGLELSLSMPPGPTLVDGDAARLAQVFSNLLNNAAKYTERGGRVSLSVERHGRDVLVSVRDTGVGIAAAMLPKLFEMFTQVDRSLEKSRGGLGIGLSLVKRLVEMHGGTVEAQSEGEGRGSEFIVRLPAATTPSAPPREDVHADAPVPAARRRVLIVDDNQDAARSLEMLLKLAGHETRTAFDGLRALEVAAEFQPDLAIVDIGMPDLNGHDFARRIRAQPWGQEVVLVALTGWGQEEDRRQSAEAGFDHHLVKPVDADTLTRLLADV